MESDLDLRTGLQICVAATVVVIILPMFIGAVLGRIIKALKRDSPAKEEKDEH